MKLRLTALASSTVLAMGLWAATAQQAAAQNPVTDLLTGFGILSSDTPEIDYRERAPLVVPPREGLREPQPGIEQRAGNWPVDPDVERRKRAASNRLLPMPFQHGNERPELSAADLRAGRRANTATQAPARSAIENERYELLYQPMQQMTEADKRRADAAQDLTPGSEPPRRSLAEPPAGYRRATQIVKPKRDNFVPMGDSTGQKTYAVEEKRSYQ